MYRDLHLSGLNFFPKVSKQILLRTSSFPKSRISCKVEPQNQKNITKPVKYIFGYIMYRWDKVPEDLLADMAKSQKWKVNPSWKLCSLLKQMMTLLNFLRQCLRFPPAKKKIKKKNWISPSPGLQKILLNSRRTTSEKGWWYWAHEKNEVVTLLRKIPRKCGSRREWLGGSKVNTEFKRKSKTEFSRIEEQSFWDEGEEDVRLELWGALNYSDPLKV